MRRLTLLAALVAIAALAACHQDPGNAKTTESAGEASSIADTVSTPAIVPASAVPEPSTGDWPRFRGPNANGISPETGINKAWASKPPRLLWKTAMTDDGFAGPSVAGGRVYIIDHQGSQDIVRAFDLKTGDEAWHYAYPDTDKPNYGFARSTPTVDGDRVYTLSRLGKLHCFNTADGSVIWSRDIVGEFQGKLPGWQLAGSPVIDGDKLIVCPGGDNAAVVALDKKDGKTIWQGGGSEAPGYATPVITNINGVKQYVVFFIQSVGGVDAGNGKLLWSHPWTTRPEVNAATPVVIGNSVFVTSGYGFGCGLVDVTPAGAKLRWQNKEIQAHFSSPILSNGYIYGTGDPGVLVCLNPNTGKALWKQTGFEKGGIIAAEGAIIGFNGSNGDLIMARMSPAGYQELGRITPLGGQSWTAPVLASGKLLVRNKGTLACLDLK